MQYLINITAVIASFCAMEAIAWLTHKYIMHGKLWYLHADHHHKGEGQIIERNDSFFIIFATPGILLLYFGLQSGLSKPWFWMGLGITLYGFAYFLVHDVFIHQRFKWFRNSNWIYFKAIRRAHKMHHKNLSKENGMCFGMLWVPIKYYREVNNKV